MTSPSQGPQRSRPRTGGRPNPIPAANTASAHTPWVRVTCPECGIVRVRADRVVVRNCLDDASWSYRARCSNCDVTFVDSTPVALALPAVAAGLAVELWTLPTPSPRRGGDPLEMIDALELHLALLEPDWFEQLTRMEPFEES